MNGDLLVGLDGWPRWRVGERDVEPREALKKRIEQTLGSLHRAAKAGSFDAVTDAAYFCAQNSISTPAWLPAALERMRSLSGSSIDRTRRIERRYQIDYVRWDTVRELRDRKDELAALGYLPTFDAAYANAAAALNGTLASGGADAIAKSYKKVQKAMKNGTAAKHYVRLG